MQDPTDAKTLWMRERQAELAEATVQGAHRGVPINSRDGGKRPVIGFRGRCCNFPWWRTSFLRENLGQDRPSVRVSGVSSRGSVQPGPCNHSLGPETGEADTMTFF